MVAACPAPEPPAAPIPPVSAGKVRVRVFTEPSSARIVQVAGKFVFVATEDELQRWDGTSVLAMAADRGLSGSHVVALASDSDRKWLWVLTDGGFGHYDTANEVYAELAPPPASMGIDYAAIAKDGSASLASASEPGVWLGTAKGLVFVSDKGGWLPTPIKDPIRALARDHAGWLWIATKTGLVARKPTGDVVKIGAAQGCAIVEPRIVLEAADDRMLVIGADAEGHERIAIGTKTTWASYRALPELTWDAATKRGNAVVVMGGGRLYRIARTTPTTVRPLARDGVRLVPLASGATDEWVIDPIDVVVPPSATTLGAFDDQLLIGTHDLGTARYLAGDAHPRDWLRRKQMFEDATTLSVACTRQQDCWIATGARQAWHWTGDRFVEGGPDTVILAVARDPSGPIYAIHRSAIDKELHLSRIDGTTWTQVPKVALATPGERPEVSFARFSGSGTLWVGLRYKDGEERRAYGIAIVEPSTGKVTYHHTEAPDRKAPDKKQKMLPIPVGVVDADVRGEVAWFATNEGVARLDHGQVKLWNEATGLRSELARAVTIVGDAGVIVATGAGAGVWNGKQWDFPAALAFEINDVVATRNGQVWMATERGIAAWDGQKVRRVDMRRGLVENEVADIAADQFDRVWARGPGSLTLISQ
ncbi:MAG: two component regulator propeller domain protein [Myxococcales bacterium]|nr:two component regulator propeller domain protein [Myxococcales bacterium]